ncbi:MAG: phosphate starvation-inducible protein PhoH [Candidatus Amoebophilus sp. 36-38]|nr:MAG: phosphate starvation-inducible protein PhoH [Candidatus Amoebophilus sp. 36-38]
MIEKTIQLEEISLVDFLGVENRNITALGTLFPTAKLISRGNEIKIQGSQEVVQKLDEIIQSLLRHYRNQNLITQELIYQYASQREEVLYELEKPTYTIFHTAKGKSIKPRTFNQRRLVNAVPEHALTFVVGFAGTGKTYISVALALQALKRKEVEKIVVTRPIVEAGESLGFLPGYLEEKTAPYLYPIYDAIDDMISIEKRKYYQEHGIIEVVPLAYMRGRTLHNAFVVLDEAQNTTVKQMKMFLTRMGLHSKFIITGDTTQIDLPNPKQSGLLDAIKILADVPGISFIHMDEHDIVRHKLIKSIIQAYENSEKQDK